MEDGTLASRTVKANEQDYSDGEDDEEGLTNEGDNEKELSEDEGLGKEEDVEVRIEEFSSVVQGFSSVFSF